MLPDPLHPAVVHLPIALSVLVPILALLTWAAIRRSWLPPRTWWAVVLLQAMLVGSSWLALETGENEEDRVEAVVAEQPINAHEEAAERFLVLAGLALLVSGAGLLPAGRGATGRLATSVATFIVLLSAIQVGHSGGELVYKHGAASAYLDQGIGAVSARTLADDE